MLRSALLLSLSLAACAPTTATSPGYVAPRAAAAPGHGLAIRGRIPQGRRVDYIVAVQIDRQGRRHRIRVRPAADGSYALQLPPGHRYAMAYELGGRMVGNVTFPHNGRQSQVINVSQNVTVNQGFIDLGDTTYIDGRFVAASDPEQFLDSDGDGVVDAQDPDDADEGPVAIEPDAFDGDFDEVDETVD